MNGNFRAHILQKRIIFSQEKQLFTLRLFSNDIKKIMMTSSNGNIFRVTGHFYGEFTIPRWIPRTKASDAEL